MKRHDHHRDTVDEAFDRFVRIAVSEYNEAQQRFERKISAFSRWRIDTVALTLIFEAHDAKPLVTSFVPVATYLPSAESWAWAWANDAWSDNARNRAAHVKELTQQTQYNIFSTPSFR